jgi:transketolase
MGESISGLLAKQNPCPMEFVATQDTFGESGTPAELMTKYGLDKDAIIKKVLAVKNRI